MFILLWMTRSNLVCIATSCTQAIHVLSLYIYIGTMIGKAAKKAYVVHDYNVHTGQRMTKSHCVPER